MNETRNELTAPPPELPVAANGHHPYGFGGEAPPRAHLSQYLEVVRRYRWPIAGFVLLGTALVIAYSLVMPQTFSASATLLPPDKAQGVSFTQLLTQGAGFDLEGFGENSSAEIFVKILTSRVLADSLIRRFDLLDRFGVPEQHRELVEQAVRGGLQVSSDRQGMITVGYQVATGYLPTDSEKREAAELAAGMVNGALEVLNHLNVEKSISSARRSREFVGRMLELKRIERDSAQRLLLAFQQSNKAVALDRQIDATVSALAELQVQIQRAEVELTRAQSEFTADSRPIESIRSQLSRLREQKIRLESGRAGGEAFSINLRDVPDLGRQYANLKLDLEVATQMYTYLVAQYNQEQIQEARDLPTVNVLDHVVVPAIRSAPRRGMMAMVAFPTLAIMALIGAFLYDAFRRQRLAVRQEVVVSAERTTTVATTLGRGPEA